MTQVWVYKSIQKEGGDGGMRQSRRRGGWRQVRRWGREDGENKEEK